MKIGRSASEMLALLTLAYDRYTMKKLSVFEWHRWSKEGQEDVQDDPKSGQSKAQKTDENANLGVFRLKIRCKIISVRKLWNSVQKKE
jgi:hypothetical protein